MHAVHAAMVFPHQSMQRQLSYRRDGQTDRRTDGQTAFQLYIAKLVDYYFCKNHCSYYNIL